MLDYKIQQYNKEIKRLDRALRKFERLDNKDSSVFFEEFKKGRLRDNMDFIEWASLYQMRSNLIEKKVELEGKN